MNREEEKMIVCQNCNKQMSETAAFCSSCGSKLKSNGDEADKKETLDLLPHTDEPVPDEGNTTTTESFGSESAQNNFEIPEKKNQKVLKTVVLGCLVATLALTAVFYLIWHVLSGGLTSKVNQNHIFYLKDEEIVSLDLDKDGTRREISTDLVTIDVEDDYSSWIDSVGRGLNYFTYIDKEGTLIFYPDKVDPLKDEGCGIYYRSIQNPEAEPVKVDSDIQAYTVSEGAEYITYIRGDAGNLYQYTRKTDTKEKIAADVESFCVNDDGSKIGYIDTEGNVYLKRAGKDNEKVVSDVSYVVYVNEDLTMMFYIKDDTLYKQVEGEGRVKIAEDFSKSYYVVKVYDSGEIYYMKEHAETVALSAYVEDDLKEADAKIIEPVEPVCPYLKDYDTVEEYNLAYSAYLDAYSDYNAAKNEFDYKSDRDYLREELEKNTVEVCTYSLCYHNGVEEVVLTEAYADFSAEAAVSSPVVAYCGYSQTDVKKIKLSEAWGSFIGIDSYKEWIDENKPEADEAYVAVKGTVTKLDNPEAKGYLMNDTGTELYYFTNFADDDTGADLYHISIRDGVIGEAECYDKDVYYVHRTWFMVDDKIIYFKNFKGDYGYGHGDLYVNGEKIDYDVFTKCIQCCQGTDRLIYFVDYDEENQSGTMKAYENGVATIVSNDAYYDYNCMPDGRILYLCDYKTEYYRGELYEWRSGNKRKLDDDVTSIIKPYDMEIKGSYWFG